MLLPLSLSFSSLAGDPEPLRRVESPPPLLFRWNHGPGTSGGGSSTASGETLRQGRFSLDLRGELTRFAHVSVAEAEAQAIAHDEFDALERSLVNSVSLAYGWTDDLQLGLTLGHYSGSNFIAAEADGLGGASSATADPGGLTDTWVNAKWRVMRDASGNLALIGGIKLPTGKDDETLSNGERLEPSSQPGSGSVDYQAGVAFSRFLTARLTLDASALYTVRTAHEGFEVGDRADLGLALAYRLTEDVKAPDNWSVFAELAGLWLDKDVDHGVTNENSGGKTLYLALGARDRFNEHVALSLAPALPIHQDENGAQVETDWRLALTLSLTP